MMALPLQERLPALVMVQPVEPNPPPNAAETAVSEPPATPANSSWGRDCHTGRQQRDQDDDQGQNRDELLHVVPHVEITTSPAVSVPVIIRSPLTVPPERATTTQSVAAPVSATLT